MDDVFIMDSYDSIAKTLRHIDIWKSSFFLYRLMFSASFHETLKHDESSTLTLDLKRLLTFEGSSQYILVHGGECKYVRM
jgi:ACT domain-containing protein